MRAQIGSCNVSEVVHHACLEGYAMHPFCLLLVGFVTTNRGLSAGDCRLLFHLRHAARQMTDKHRSFARYQQEVPLSDARKAGQLFAKVHRDSEEYAEIAFAQAFYYIDYRTNLNRL